MPFVIIKTVEDGETLITAVPTTWVENEILCWPLSTKTESLRRKESSRPDKTWMKMTCKVLRHNIRTLEEALILERHFLTTTTDNESEELNLKQACKRPQTDKKGCENDCTNYNGFFEEFNDPSSCINNDSMISDNAYQPDCHIIEPNAAQGFENIEVLTIDAACLKLLPQIFEKIEKMDADYKLEMSKLQIKLDRILKWSENQGTASSSHFFTELEMDPDDLLFPLNTIDDIQKLEEKLNTSNYFTKLVKMYTQQLGSTGQQDGKRVAYALTDKLFTRQVLTQYTWTGVSKQHDKTPFVLLKNIRDLMFKVLLMADNRFTEIAMESFFKNCVLKHANTRSAKSSANPSVPRTYTKRVLQVTSED